jgi:glycine/D-amino acid oxidase-like deaminating enzyme
MDINGNGVFYGFPDLPNDRFPGPTGLKLGLHYPMLITDPDHVDRKVSSEEEMLLRNFMTTYLPTTDHTTLETKTCLYGNSEDENFIIDHLPGYDGDVTIACGFSGHGFKFVSVIGEIMCDLTMKGKSSLPIDFLSLKRF